MLHASAREISRSQVKRVARQRTSITCLPQDRQPEAYKKPKMNMPTSLRIASKCASKSVTWDSHVKAQEERKLRCRLQEYYETSGKKMHFLLAFPVVGKVHSPSVTRARRQCSGSRSCGMKRSPSFTERTAGAGASREHRMSCKDFVA